MTRHAPVYHEHSQLSLSSSRYLAGQLGRLTIEFPSINRTVPSSSWMLQTGLLQPIQQDKNERCSGDDDHPIIDFEQAREGQVAKITLLQNALSESRV